MVGLRKTKQPLSRVSVGFNRLGIVLCVPFLLLAAVLAFFAWQNPTWRTAVNVPEGAVAWGFGDDPDDATAKQLIAKQRADGFDLPAGMMFVGFPYHVSAVGLGAIDHDPILARHRLPQSSSSSRSPEKTIGTVRLTRCNANTVGLGRVLINPLSVSAAQSMSASLRK